MIVEKLDFDLGENICFEIENIHMSVVASSSV